MNVIAIRRRWHPATAVEPWQPRWEGLAPPAQPEAFGRANVFETNNAYIVQIEIPGVGPEEIVVDVAAGSVDVQANRVPGATSEETVRRLERWRGHWSRRFSFSAPIDAARVTADLSKGILTLHAPKLLLCEPRRVPVSLVT